MLQRDPLTVALGHVAARADARGLSVEDRDRARRVPAIPVSRRTSRPGRSSWVRFSTRSPVMTTGARQRIPLHRLQGVPPQPVALSGGDAWLVIRTMQAFDR